MATGPADSIENMWVDVAKRFQDNTKNSVHLNPPKSLQECIQKIEDTRNPTESRDDSKREKAKKYGITVVQCLKLLGGVAARGGEMMFGAPSNICFNALFLLLDIPEKIKDFRDQIDGLFAALEPALSNFRIYERIDQCSNLEPELKSAIHKVMISFVDICAISIKLRDASRWRKFKDGVKLVVLQDDSEIKSHIEEFQKLNQDHNWLQSTQILKTSTQTLGAVLEMDSNLKTFLFQESENMQKLLDGVATLSAADETRRLEDVRRKQLENIKSKLGIDDALYGNLKNMSDKPRHDTAPNTSNWFTNLSEFNQWAERNNLDSKALFCLTGAQNTGKSTILSAMTHRLQSVYEMPTRQSPRTLVASYFFSATTSKDGKDDLNKRPIATALKCIALQFAHQHHGYARFLSEAFNSKSDDSQFFIRDLSCRELWEFLAIGTPKGNATHYLILDGLADLPEETIESKNAKAEILDIILDSVSPNVRVLLSAREDPFHMERLASYYHIQIAEHNRADIEIYIQHDMESRNIFQDLEDKPLRARIRETLVKQVSGNFNKVKVALDQLRQVEVMDGLEADIDKILEESNMDEKQISETVISQLQEKLTGPEIDELNELLSWVVCGACWFNVEQLSAVLVLRFKRRGTMRLRRKIEGKYSNILKIDEAGNVVLADGLMDLLIMRRDRPRSDDDTPTFSATITINKGDARTVQSFLWSLSQKIESAQHGNFGFQTIDEKMSKKTIQVNEVDAYLAILRRTFNILADNHANQSEANEVAPLLLEYLPQHLQQLQERANGFDTLTPSEMQEIGTGLFSLFASEKIIERQWSNCADVVWLRRVEEAEIFRKWLAKPEVTCHLGMLDRDWLGEIEASLNPNQKLFSKMMRTVAKHWLCDRAWDAPMAFDWLVDYMRIPLRQSNENEENEQDEDASDSGSSQDDQDSNNVLDVRTVADWCSKEFNILTENKAILYERIGRVHSRRGETSLAIQAYKESIAHGSRAFESIEGLAVSLSRIGQYGEACEWMNEGLKVLEEDQISDPENRLTAYHCLGRWYAQLGQSNRTMDYIKKSNALRPENEHIFHDGLMSLLDYNLLKDAADLISDAVALEKPDTNTSLLERVLNLIICNDETVVTILPKICKVVLSRKDTFAALVENMARVVKNSGEIDGRTLFCEGILSYYHSKIEEVQPEHALKVWNKCFRTDPSTDWNKYAFMWACAYHCDSAKALLESDPEAASYHLQQLRQITAREVTFRTFGSNTYLGAYYAHIERDITKSRLTLKPSFDVAITLLSDEVEDNDWHGYTLLSRVLRSSGDDSGALCAFSLLSTSFMKRIDMSYLLQFENADVQALSDELIQTLPDVGMNNCQLPDQLNRLLKKIGAAMSSGSVDDVNTIDDKTKAAYEEIQSQIHEIKNAGNPAGSDFNCDGLCGKRWDFVYPFNICKYCANNGFCDDCFKKLKEGELENLHFDTRCNKGHEWLRLERLTKESYLNSLRKKVQVGEELVDAREWLDALKEEWACGLV